MAAKMMQAVQYDTFGGGASALKHVEIPVPTPGKDQVLVKVEAASVNPVDWKLIQAGTLKLIFPKLPHTHQLGGSLAEYPLTPIRGTVKRPDNVSAIDGACLGVAGETALQSICDSAGLKLDGSSAEKNLLITATSGGVGTFAVQIAKLAGAHVTATCGAHNIELVKSLGADEVLDYNTNEGATLESPSGKKYDIVIHGSKFQPFSFFKPQLAPGARVIDLTPSGRGLLATIFQLATFLSQQFVPFFMKANTKDLKTLTDLIHAGKLKTVMDSTYPLSRAEEAWTKQIEGHATGKVVITMKTSR